MARYRTWSPGCFLYCTHGWARQPSRNWPYEWAQEAPAETGQTTEAHYFSTLLAGYQQATNKHNSFYGNMLHKQKDIPAPAKTSFWKHLLTLQKRSKRLSTKHLSNIHTVKRVESSEPLATRQDVTQDTLTESQTDRFRGSCCNT